MLVHSLQYIFDTMKQKLIFIGNSIVAGYPWNKSKSFVSVLRRALKGDAAAGSSSAAGGAPVNEDVLVKTADREFTVDCIDLSTPAFAKATGFDLINKGVNGDTTEGILRRFKSDVMDHEPNMVFILTGTN